MRNMKLGAKMTLAFGLILAGLVAVVSIDYTTISSTTGAFCSLLDREVAIEKGAAAARAQMLQCRRNEKDFLLRKDTKYVDQHLATWTEMHDTITHVADLAEEADAKEIHALAQSIASHALDYRSSFESTVNAWKDRGLDHASGLQGEFRTAAHDLSEVLKEHAVDDFYIMYLMMRRWEKDYVRTEADKYKQRLLTLLDTYRTELEASECEATAKETQLAALSRYTEAYNNYLAASSEDARAASYEVMRDEAQVMEDAINSVLVRGARALLLDIRKNEKDYLLRGDEKYVEATRAACDTLLAHVTEAGILEEHAADIEQRIGEYRAAFNALVEEDQHITAAIADMREKVHSIEAELDDIVQLNASDARVLATTKSADHSKLFSLCLGVILALCAAAVATFLTRSTTRSIRNVITGLSKGSEQVSYASSQVASSSQQMAQGASEQASSLEETSASLEEMSSMTNQNADNANQADRLMREAEKVVGDAANEMTGMREAINAIQGSAEETAKIIKTIDEIAFQTNLLALNAAVEAARAGDAGKGFAVVAEEVRNLAQRSAAAAKDTAQLIEESQRNASNGVQVTESLAGTLGAIQESAAKVGKIVSEIAAASSEQARGIEQVNTAVLTMNTVTQSNAANSEEAAAASEELSAQAGELMEAVRTLVGIVGSSKTDEKQPVAHSFERRVDPSSHAAALPKAAPQATLVKPEAVLPLDDDDLNEF